MLTLEPPLLNRNFLLNKLLNFLNNIDKCPKKDKALKLTKMIEIQSIKQEELHLLVPHYTWLPNFLSKIFVDPNLIFGHSDVLSIN